MLFRKAIPSDATEIMEIISQAQHFFRENGIPQWENNYPNINTVRDDIEKDINYVLEEDGHVIATMVLIFTGEPDYDRIYDGHWLTDGKYAAIHRIAVSEKLKNKGIASELIAGAIKKCEEFGFHSIRIDTHEKNKPMQGMLKRNGFVYCGGIFLEDGSPRIAFEKVF